jgi:hypothetical protein
MFKKTDKRRLYWLIDLYLNKTIDAQTFCDEYYDCYSLELNFETLNAKEAEAFHELSGVINRFSPFEEDHKNLPGVYFTEYELRQKIIEIKNHFSKKDFHKTDVVFLYPCDPLDTQRVDEQYQKEYSMAREKGLLVHHFNIDNIMHSSITPAMEANVFIVYRGWMLAKALYSQLEQRFGDALLISTEDYCNAHYLPHWYEDIKPFTIPSIITDEKHVLEQFKEFPGKAFIKDYVKSLKTGKGSIVTSEAGIVQAVSDMKFYRGAIEGGIVLREVVELIPDSETRFFVVNGKIFSPKKDIVQYKLVENVVLNMEHKNLPFYSVDVATKKDGNEIVIEIGDGQVSDYVGWSLDDFIKVLSYLKKQYSQKIT